MLTSSYSPQREGCGIMQLHSPTQNHHYDPQSAISEIRRTLSRSPSKPYNFRSSVHHGNTSYTPSPLSPSRRSTSENILHFQNMSSPYGTRSTQPGRIQRPNLRRTANTVATIRTRTSPKSPTKRTLFDSNSHLQSSQPLRKRRSTEIDNDIDLLDEENKENISTQHEDQAITWKAVQTKQEKRRSGGFLCEVQPLSPRKRPDCAMNVDQINFGSPSAKRRSIHAPTSMDFSIFESDTIDEAQRRTQDDHDWFKSIPMSPASRFSTLPRRTSSLRKSTIQQRQSDRSSPLRLNNFAELRQNWSDATPNMKKPPRMSLDLPPPQRDSPFSTQGDLLNASIHPITASQGHPSQEIQFRHPLAQSMTRASSSTPSVQDDSPTHEPPRRNDRSKSHDFSKSLPLGALRPTQPYESQSTQFSSQGSFATPAAFKDVKPFAAAFMSTGLISKKNRNFNESDNGVSKPHMPDTPCKKQTMMFPPPKDKTRPTNNAITNLQNSFGTPKSPSEVPFGISRANPFPWARSSALFPAKAKQSLARKASFASLVSIEADDKPVSRSPAVPGDSQSTDCDYPPTPTKHDVLAEGRFSSVSPSPRHTAPRPDPSMSSQVTKFATSKLSPVPASPASIDGDSDSIVDDSPSARLKSKSIPIAMTEAHSLTPDRRSRRLNSPTPVSSRAVGPSALSFRKERHAKLAPSPVSPYFNEFNDSSPHTPLEAVYPPDPSSLSISGKQERPSTRNGPESPYVPETPTGPREYFSNFSNRPSLNLNAPDVADVDQNLSSKFNKVDLIGTGQFSQVYRVSDKTQPSPFNKSFASGRPSSPNSMPGNVWAVKKSRHPYSGPKDRARKVHEVDVLKTLGQDDHVLSFVDSWEDQGYLYIQTEFCEEGTLDVFLAQTGLKGRIDDFRIWKILFEVSLGLQHIHNSGYIHLDLKPANILVTFEGVLKIADFGMATRWPAKSGNAEEGDREYMSPEVLHGRFDKPADVFALGLIMFETAGNVQLPDNGVSWQKLRNGDTSDVPSLTWSSEENSNILRDASGVPVEDDDSNDNDVEFMHSGDYGAINQSHAAKITQIARRGELVSPPSFMIDAFDNDSLDCLVRWMISPSPDDRPPVQKILESRGVQWAAGRRRAGATIFEGNWGPADEILEEDSEMLDV